MAHRLQYGSEEVVKALYQIIERMRGVETSLTAILGVLESAVPERTTSFFDYDEPARLPVTTAASSPYEFKEKPVEFLWLYAAGAPIQVSLDKAVSGESFIIPNGAIISVTKKTRRVYGVSQVGVGNLYIWGFYNR